MSAWSNTWRNFWRHCNNYFWKSFLEYQRETVEVFLKESLWEFLNLCGIISLELHLFKEIFAGIAEQIPEEICRNFYREILRGISKDFFSVRNSGYIPGQFFTVMLKEKYEGIHEPASVEIFEGFPGGIFEKIRALVSKFIFWETSGEDPRRIRVGITEKSFKAICGESIPKKKFRNEKSWKIPKKIFGGVPGCNLGESSKEAHSWEGKSGGDFPIFLQEVHRIFVHFVDISV